MPKVLYVLDTLQTGGAERSTLDIASRLKTFQPVVCHIYRNDFLKPEFEKQNIPVISLNVAGPYQFVKAYRALKDVLRREKPDVVIATLLRTELISRVACKALGIPIVGTFVNDTYSPYEWQSLSLAMKGKVGFFWFFNMVTARFCAGFLSNGESIKESNCKALFVPRNKVKVIFRGRRKDLFVFRERHPNPDQLKFLAVGRLIYRKGFEELLQAFHLYHKRFPNATLTIAGDGPWRGRLQQLTITLNLQQHVILAGTQKDMPALMEAHDVFVFPSHYEGFSGTVVEAMFSGIPIVASDIAMNREALEHGQTGWMFPVMNVSALAEGLVFMTQNFEEGKRFARHARKVAEDRFDIDVIAAQHEKYYQEIQASKE
ncbi:MAG TPA: glycosyltransferase family 4 protein [Chryseolinea sp.]